MPKGTFFNLPDEKRQLIENTAISEFASFGFDKASINSIVLKSGIAKGSFYQYFLNKKDLFLHVIVTVAAGRKIRYMSSVLRNPEGYDFFTVIKELFISGLRFASENPELEKLGMWVVNNTHHPVYDELFGEAGHSAKDIYVDMIKKAQQRGEIREGVDVAYISHLFPALLSGTMDYCLKSSGKTVKSGVTDISDEIMETVDLMIGLLRSGIGGQQPARSDV